jgi:K(+)-stimulated pyrophosphate-energized sodium pump
MNRFVKRLTLLDAVGNTTKAVTKGYAIGSAGLAALVLFAAYTDRLARTSCRNCKVTFSLAKPLRHRRAASSARFCRTLFGAMSMTAVGRAAGEVVKDVRASSANDPGHHDLGKVQARTTARTVDLVTKAAIKEMIIPSLLPVLGTQLRYISSLQTRLHGQAEGFAMHLERYAAGCYRRRPVRCHLDDIGRWRMGQR